MLIRYTLALFWDQTMKNHFGEDAEYKITEAVFHAQPVFFRRTELETIFKFKITRKMFLNLTYRPSNHDL